ncbi:MAG: hypothetical protein AAF559_04130 [Pseudomonadota bacterium]
MGTYRDLIRAGSKGDDITPNHIPSANRMAREGVSRGDGIATSIKSIDLDAPSYLSGNGLRSTLTRYVDKVAAFNGKKWAGKTIRADSVTGRSLDVVVPHGGTAAQQATLNDMIQYGSKQGVTVSVIPFP